MPSHIELQIVKATLSQVAAIASVLTDATRYKVERGDSAWGSHGPTEAAVLEQMKSGEMYVALNNREVIATARLQWEDEHYWGKQPPVAGYLHGLAVRKDAHGKRVATHLLTWAAQEVAVRGLQYLRLDCASTNLGLCRYYERQGFSQAGQRVLQSGYIAALYQRNAAV